MISSGKGPLTVADRPRADISRSLRFVIVVCLLLYFFLPHFFPNDRT